MTLGNVRYGDQFMTLRQPGMISIFILAWLTCSPARAADFTGVPRIVDGDTLVIGTTNIRLERIYAPETDQICLNANGIRWTCGIDARDQLAVRIAGREVKCTSNGVDANRRTLATCYLAGEDLNNWMVQQGWALAYVRQSFEYVHAEENARAQKRGLWQGAFIAPWDWRHRKNETTILGAFSVPINAKTMLLGPSASAGPPSPECTIKGNVTRTGKRIYYMQNQRSYARIKMNKGGRRWFCAPEEAEVAGWRKAVR
jgi:endonuclease YncB( thermonuclease family)